MVETTHAKPFTRNGRKHTKENGRLMIDATDHVGAPKSHRRNRRFPYRYTGYIALMSECIVTELSSFEEAVQQPTWVDAMVDYDSIIRINAWEVVPRPMGKSVVGFRWIYKVKQAANGSEEK